MGLTLSGCVLAAGLGSVVLLSALQSQTKPEDELAAIVKTYLSKDMVTDWRGIEKLPSIKWGPLPPKMLQHCLPDGGCFTRQGTAAVGGRNLVVMATGARTIVSNLYLRNGSAAFGEPAVLGALKAAGYVPELARCPIKSGAGGTNWYRLKSEGANRGVFSIQPPAGQRSEGFVLSQSEELPTLQPNQVSLYSEQCTGDAERKPVSTLKPHEVLAQTVVAVLGSASGPTLHDWKALTGLSTGIAWAGDGPKPMNLSFMNDPNPVSQTGSATYAGRKFSVTASGTEAHVKAIHLEENGLHPRGEHMLGVVYEKGIAVRLVRCGPVYTEMTQNWYSLGSAKTRPAMIMQSISYEGNQVTDRYTIRLDGTLPNRDPRDRDPGVNGCR